MNGLPHGKTSRRCCTVSNDRKVALLKADKSWKEPEALPVMFNADERAGGQDQSELIKSWAGRCCACGRIGCKDVAAGCTAMKGELHPELPDRHRAQAQRMIAGGGGGGGGGGGDGGGGAAKRRQPWRNLVAGNCKYGDSCKSSNVTGIGDGGTRQPSTTK